MCAINFRALVKYVEVAATARSISKLDHSYVHAHTSQVNKEDVDFIVQEWDLAANVTPPSLSQHALRSTLSLSLFLSLALSTRDSCSSPKPQTIGHGAQSQRATLTSLIPLCIHFYVCLHVCSESVVFRMKFSTVVSIDLCHLPLGRSL